jgi:hypothetical protein
MHCQDRLQIRSQYWIQGTSTNLKFEVPVPADNYHPSHQSMPPSNSLAPLNLHERSNFTSHVPFDHQSRYSNHQSTISREPERSHILVSGSPVGAPQLPFWFHRSLFLGFASAPLP